MPAADDLDSRMVRRSSWKVTVVAPTPTGPRTDRHLAAAAPDGVRIRIPIEVMTSARPTPQSWLGPVADGADPVDEDELADRSSAGLDARTRVGGANEVSPATAAARHPDLDRCRS